MNRSPFAWTVSSLGHQADDSLRLTPVLVAIDPVDDARIAAQSYLHAAVFGRMIDMSYQARWVARWRRRRDDTVVLVDVS